MRVHIYFNRGNRMDGAPYAMYRAFERIPGVESCWYECRTNPKFLPKADLNVAVDWAEDALGYGDYVEPHPNVYWASDTHISEDSWNFRINKAKRFDRVFVSIKTDVEKFAAAGVKAEWMPYAAEPLSYRPCPDIEFTADVGFTGFTYHSPERIAWLDGIFRAFPSFHIEYGKFFEDAARDMARSRIVLNHCHADSTNMRVFEALAAENCLLTRATSDLNALGLIGGRHLLTYTSVEDARETIALALSNPEWRQDMAEAGRDWVLHGHTYLHRAYRMLDRPLPDEETFAAMLKIMPTMESTVPTAVRKEMNP